MSFTLEILPSRSSTSPTAEVSLARFSVDEVISSKFSARFTIPQNDLVVEDVYINIREDHATQGQIYWFIGKVRDVSDEYRVAGANVTDVECFCLLEDLSRLSVGNLEIYDFALGKPQQVRRINTTANATGNNENDLEDDETDDFAIPELVDGSSSYVYQFTGASGSSLGNNRGLDTLMVGDLVPFKGTEFTLVSGQGNTLQNSTLIHQWLKRRSDGKGWVDEGVTDGTNGLTQSGTMSMNTDLSEQWLKSSQSDQNLFWARVWFYKSGGFPEQTGAGTVEIAEIKIQKRVGVDDAVNRILALASEWLSLAGPSSQFHSAIPVYHVFQNESAMAALRVVTEYTGGYFVNVSVPTGPSLKWYPVSDANLPPASDDHVISRAAGYVFYDLSVDRFAPSATRLTLYGGGRGDNRITAQLQDVYPLVGDAGNNDSLAQFTVGTDTYIYNPASNILANITAEATLGYEIAGEMSLKRTHSLYASGQSVEASNQLIQSGVEHLKKSSLLNRVEMVVRVGNAPEKIPVGEVVRLIYDKNGEDIDDYFVVVSASHSYSGNFVSTYTLSMDGYKIDTGSGRVAETITLNDSAAKYPQPVLVRDVEEDDNGLAFLDLGNNGRFEQPDIQLLFGTVCVPHRAFADQFDPSHEEFLTWLGTGTNDTGDGGLYGYLLPGEADVTNYVRKWTSNGDGTAELTLEVEI